MTHVEEHQATIPGERGRPQTRSEAGVAWPWRSRIVLGCAAGLSNTEVAASERVSAPTVGKWRSRFCELRLDGLDGLEDDPRPGRPGSITAEQVEDVVVATLESTPRNATHWSRASIENVRPQWCCAWTRKPRPGAGPLAAGVPDDARHAGETQPRLRPARHHQPVRRVQHASYDADSASKSEIRARPSTDGISVMRQPIRSAHPGHKMDTGNDVDGRPEGALV